MNKLIVGMIPLSLALTTAGSVGARARGLHGGSGSDGVDGAVGGNYVAYLEPKSGKFESPAGRYGMRPTGTPWGGSGCLGGRNRGLSGASARRHRLTSQGYECAQPVVVQVESSPEQRGDIDRKEGVSEQRTADPHVGSDRATQIARQQDCTED